MTYCKRCELGYIKNGGKIENIKEAEVWVPFEDNVIWHVCAKCAEAITYSNRALALSKETPIERIQRRRRQYMKEGKI